MDKSFLYWFFMLLIALCWVFGGYSLYGNPDRRFFGAYAAAGLFQFILFFIIGLALFGSPIK